LGLKIKTIRSLPVGVDLGSSCLKMAQLQISAQGAELVAAGLCEVPQACQNDMRRRLDFQGEQIRKLVKSNGFKGRQAILSLPADAVFLQPVRIPIVPKGQIDQAVSAELEGKLPCPLQEAVIRHILAGTVYVEGREMHERIVVAVPRRDLEAYLAMAQQAGLEPVGVNIEACAVVECFARVLRRVSDESRVTLFIDIGFSSTQVVLARGQSITFARNLSVGGRLLEEAVAQSMHISLDQAHAVRQKMLSTERHTQAENELFLMLDVRIAEISDEITQCLRYHESVFRNQAVERVVFVGGQAHDKRLCQLIANGLNLPAQVGDPMAGISRARQGGSTAGLDARQPSPSWAVAIGLSLGATLAA